MKFITAGVLIKTFVLGAIYLLTMAASYIFFSWLVNEVLISNKNRTKFILYYYDEMTEDFRGEST